MQALAEPATPEHVEIIQEKYQFFFTNTVDKIAALDWGLAKKGGKRRHLLPQKPI